MNRDGPASGADPGGEAAAGTGDKLVRIGVQVEALQALLVRLLQDVVATQGSVGSDDAASLVEVNEKLVQSALANLAKAEAATAALGEAERAAGLDALTGLPNRRIFLDRLTQAVASSRRRDSRSAVAFLDLDDFKSVNDRHGHAFGDKVLRLAAQRMLPAVRDTDTVCRQGGDEFLILMVDVARQEDAHRVVDKVLEAITAPAQIDGIDVHLTASAGVAVYPDDAEDAAALIAKADAAMYATKARRSGGMALRGDAVSPPPTPRAQDASRAVDVQRVETDLRDANERLILAALSAEQLREAAELARMRQSAVLAAVAEELDDPQAPIRIATTMLGSLDADKPVLSRLKGILDDQLSQISRLVGNLADGAASGTDPLEPRRRLVDMNLVVDEAIAKQMTVVKARSQQLEVVRPSGRLEVRGDAMLLELVVSNLLHNASKHTRNGGHIRLAVARGTDSITLDVSDDGIGITPAILPLIGSPFVQDTQALGFNGVGMGIGLTVVRTLVRAYGGTLTGFSSGLKRGSRFEVVLPTAGVPADAGSADAA